MAISYGSICSGIEAATQAWHPLGMRAAWFAEIDPFPSAVLAHHYPDVPNHGDMTKLAVLVLAGKIPAPEVLVGGTPCQAFSVAGMRKGLVDPRGALTIKYVELADAVDYVRAGQRKPACVVVWENVPGVLSDKGNAFGCFLGALAGEDCELQPSGKKWTDAGCVYGSKRTIAWRILDAQYFGLAQRRRRVFVVASARDGFDPTEVLFEREGVRRDTAPRRGEGQDVTGTAPFGPALQCGCGHVFAEELGEFGCVNCEGDEGPAVSMFGGIPAFGAGNSSGSIERSSTLTHHGGRQDFESETFFVQRVQEVAERCAARTVVRTSITGWLDIWLPERLMPMARRPEVQHNRTPSRVCWLCTAHRIPMCCETKRILLDETTDRKTQSSPSRARITALMQVKLHQLFVQ